MRPNLQTIDNNARKARAAMMEKLFTRGQTEGENPAGGYLVDAELENEIDAIRSAAGVMRAHARVREMGSDSRRYPRRANGFTVYPVSEATAITESEASFDTVQLNTKKHAALGRMSVELVEDARAGLTNFLSEELAFAMADFEDSAGFNGDGTSAFSGIRGITNLLIDGSHDASKIAAAAGHDTFAELDASDLGALVAAVPEHALPNAAWFCSAYGFGQTFVRLGASSGGIISTRNGPRPLFVYGGLPIITTPKMPGSGSQANKVMLACGDMKKAMTLGSRRGLRIALSENRWIDRDQIGVRATWRFDIVANDLGDNGTPGSLVGLIGTA